MKSRCFLGNARVFWLFSGLHKLPQPEVTSTNHLEALNSNFLTLDCEMERQRCPGKRLIFFRISRTFRNRENSQQKITRNKRQLVKFKESDNSQVFEVNWKLYILGLRSLAGALGARHRSAAITGSKFRIKAYLQLASLQHIDKILLCCS